MPITKRTLIVDSTQIQSFLECPQKWYYEHRLRVAPQIMPPKEAMMKGTYIHKLLEIYYKSRANGLSPTDSIKASLSYDIDGHTNCQCGHSETSHKPLGQLDVCSLCSGTSGYIHEFKRQLFPLSAAAREQVRDNFSRYCVLNVVGDVQPYNADSVEVGFSEVIYEDSEHLFILEGKIDLLGRQGVTDIIMDHKSQDYAKNLYPKAIQFRNYSMVTKVNTMLINYIRFGATVSDKYKKFDRTAVSFSADEHDWWRKQLVSIYFRMLTALDSANEYHTMTDPSSHNYAHCKGDFGYPCDYTTLCNERNNDHVKLTKISNTFVKKEEWRPW